MATAIVATPPTISLLSLTERHTDMQTAAPILTITGSDSTGGAGIQADLRTMARLGAEAMSVVTSITLQNSLGIQEFYDIPAPIIERQIDAVCDDAHPQVVKIGMIRNAASLHAIVHCLRRHKPRWTLLSPVVRSTHEELLMESPLIELLQEELLPLCSLLVVRRHDAPHFHAQQILETDGSHGRCNELCSAIAVYLNQGDTLANAIRRATLLLPPSHNDSDIPLRTLNLYHQFIALQEQLCSHCHDVNYYARQLGVSPRYLAQVTQRVTEQTPKALIEATLLFRIQQLLTSTPPLPLGAIAAQLDFSSQAHLSNFFKRLTHTTPTQYKEKQLKPKNKIE
ncbi:MAG: bifunctional hydroxymethylpyrimidine kinase/phosphomethylpyrimidine kinase [Bacteroidales bacterium]|nr:bifunctional hydroxymethylpyrimidine kinase/phosphomethylpyrimidine kinase [Bacteroidales bacterium]